MAKPRLSVAERREAYLADKQFRNTGRPEEESSPGKAGSAPSERLENFESSSDQNLQSPAQTTGQLSSPDPAVSSSADSAGGGTTGKGLKFYDSGEDK